MIHPWKPKEISKRLLSEPLAHLAEVQNYLRLLDTSTLTGLQREHVTSAIQHTAHARGLLLGLGECARIDCGRFVSTSEETDLKEVLNSITQPHLRPLAEQGIELVVNIASNFPTNVLVDRSRLLQIISNLLYAVLSFSPTGEIFIESVKGSHGITHTACISLTYRPAKETALLLFASHENRDLGYSIAARLTEALGWELTVQNEANTVAFLLEFPILEA